MSLARRDFLKLGLAQAVILTTTQVRAQVGNPLVIKRRTSPSILQGATDETRTQFSIVYNADTDLNIYVQNDSGEAWSVDLQEDFGFKGHPQKITKAYFSKLPPLTDLFLIVADATTGNVIDQRVFRTLSPQAGQELKFALCSCMHDKTHAPEIWQNLVAKNPDLILFIGDSVYADDGAPSGGATPAHLWKRFCEARSTLEIYFSKRLIPIVATWDDHDFGLNDTNSVEYRYVKESQQNFLQFFAQNESHCRFLEKGPGVSSALTISDQLILLLDDRSFRLPRGSKDPHAHWGEEQQQWFLDRMARHSGPTWLINGSQIFPQMPFKESLSAEHPQALNQILTKLRSLATKVIFSSGDVHFTEISRLEPALLGYQTYEITSSSIHSVNIPGVPHIIPNHRRIAGLGERNYVMVESRAVGFGAEFKAISYDARGREKIKLDLEVR